MSNEVVNATVYLVRHGECAGNVEQKALEPFSDILTDVGRTQAKLLGQAIKNVAFTRAYASDYPRTFETGEIILKESEATVGVELKPEVKIRERGYTGMIGCQASDGIRIMTEAMKNGTAYLQVEMPDCETVSQFEDRLINYFSELIRDLRQSDKKEETVLLVSHGLTNQRLMVLLNSRPEAFGIQNWTKNLFSEKLMRNTTFHKLVLEIPKDPSANVTGKVEYPHFREHVMEENTPTMDAKRSHDIKDQDNYTFLDDQELSKYEKETVHYCKPV